MVSFVLFVAALMPLTLAAPEYQDSQNVNVAQIIQELQKNYESRLDAYESRLAVYETKMLEYDARLKAYEFKVKELEGKLKECHKSVTVLSFGDTSGVAETTDEGREYGESGGSTGQNEPGILTEIVKEDRQRFVMNEGEKPVAFYSQLTKDVIGIGNFQTIVFDLVTTNVGRAYNVHNGMFTAPVSGLYTFIWTVCNSGRNNMQTELVKNAIVEGRQWSDSGLDADISSATGSAVLNLNASDTVWIRTNTVHSPAITGNQLTSFSGWLLYPKTLYE